MSIQKKYSEIGQAVDGSRNRKRSSAAATSKLRNYANIDDLPDHVLVEILGRLPSSKLVSRCKFVCKRWCTIMTDKYFIDRFLCLQYNKQTPAAVTHILISKQGKEIFTRLSLHLLFTELMSLYQLDKELTVVATFNDLVLCENRTSDYYYICNPCTNQWVRLPPTPPVTFEPHLHTVGLICDLPYYTCKKENQGGHVIQLNAEYNCKVVRLIFPEKWEEIFNEFKVVIFSSDTGKWRELTVSSPSGFRRRDICMEKSFACNGMLYWMGGHVSSKSQFLIGLDPFVMTSSNVEFTDHKYQCQFINIDKPDAYGYHFKCIGVKEECLQLVYYANYRSLLYVCDVNVDQMVTIEGNLKLSAEMVKVHSLGFSIFLCPAAFDPSNAEDLFFYGEYNIKYNIRTREWSNIYGGSQPKHFPLFPLALPLWPTPLPRVPH